MALSCTLNHALKWPPTDTMTKRSSRLKPWPAWAAAEYADALTAARRLRQEARQALWLLRNGGGRKLARLLPQLAQHARAANLAGLTVEAKRAGQPGERWPRWAAQARLAHRGRGAGIHLTPAPRLAAAPL